MRVLVCCVMVAGALFCGRAASAAPLGGGYAVTRVVLSTHGVSVRGGDPACQQKAFETDGAKWTTPLKWYYNAATASRAGVNAAAALREIRAANAAVTTGVSNCGSPPAGFGAYGAYQGTTSRFANVDSSGNCTRRMPDEQNTVSWGPFTGQAKREGTLAIACYISERGVMLESDIYLGSNVGIATSLPRTCKGRYDLQSVMAHEWMHSYGIEDHYTRADKDLVASGLMPPCTMRRKLGAGDLIGMARLYGYRKAAVAQP